MTTIFSQKSVEPSRSAPPPCNMDGISDGHLLGRFIRDKNEAAFEELVRRHGRMVLGVCRRVLDNPHDAEDCFQAAFLVLVRKATTVQPREMVGNWLYGVAYRTALEAKKMAARRRARERRKFDMPRPDSDLERWQELQPLLDQELSRLPDKYRVVLLACDIEGRTRKDVSAALGLPEGTVASRLARARALLAKRLARRNLAITTGALASLLAEEASAARVPAALTASTARAAAHLAAGKPVAGVISADAAALLSAVIRSLLLAKLKIASAVLLTLALLGLGIGTLLPSVNAHKGSNNEKTAPASKKEKPVQLPTCVLQKIDPVSMTIQAAEGNSSSEADEPVIHDLQVEPTAAILIDGNDGTLADLKIGACVNLEVVRGADGKPHAVRIETVGHQREGMVLALTEDTLTLKSDAVAQETTYPVQRGAWVVVNGKKAKLADLKVKMRVALRVSTGKPSVVGVNAAGAKVSCLVKAVDAAGGKLSLGIPNTPLGVDAISVAKNAAVVIDGKMGMLTDLRAGMFVTVQMSAETEDSYVVGIRAGKQ